MSKTITLQEFLHNVQDDLVAFKDMWESGQKHGPEQGESAENWPSEMSEEDWYEQFFSFIG